MRKTIFAVYEVQIYILHDIMCEVFHLFCGLQSAVFRRSENYSKGHPNTKYLIMWIIIQIYNCFQMPASSLLSGAYWQTDNTNISCFTTMTTIKCSFKTSCLVYLEIFHICRKPAHILRLLLSRIHFRAKLPIYHFLKKEKWRQNSLASVTWAKLSSMPFSPCEQFTIWQSGIDSPYPLWTLHAIGFFTSPTYYGRRDGDDWGFQNI